MFFYNYEKEIKKWLELIVVNSNVPKDIIAINFGLFEGENGYNIYLIGSKKYSSKDDDWATNEDFIPKEKYFEIKNRKINNLEWLDFLNLTSETLKKVLKSEVIENSFIGKVKHITIGFDDGDLISID